MCYFLRDKNYGSHYFQLIIQDFWKFEWSFFKTIDHQHCTLNFIALRDKLTTIKHINLLYNFVHLLLQLSSGGGRLVISSDGVWDALSAEKALECSRGMPPDAAASQIVKVYAHA